MRPRAPETGLLDGVSYTLQFARLCDVLLVDRRVWVWHIWVSGVYIGNLRTKREALDWAREYTAGGEEMPA